MSQFTVGLIHGIIVGILAVYLSGLFTTPKSKS